MPRVLLDHARFLVINKPPGVGMHQEGDLPGIVTQVQAALQLPALFPVHRLDKVTSGVLLLAKDEEANRILSAAFRERRVEKFYLALSDRRPVKKQGLIVGDMARSRRGGWKLLHTRTRPAVTQFFSGTLTERVTDTAVSRKEPPMRWFLLKPATGKTHQIRVALKSLGAPIWGDALYGPSANALAVYPPESGQPERTYLHAWALRFPWQREIIEVLAPPEDGALFNEPELRDTLQRLNPPWEQPWPALASALLRLIGSRDTSGDDALKPDSARGPTESVESD